MAWEKFAITVERTVTETAEIVVSIDEQDFADWAPDEEMTHRLVREFLQSDSEYPANLPVENARWSENDVEYDIVG